MILDNSERRVVTSKTLILFSIIATAIAKELCYRFQKAVVSTSANISGEPTPRFFAEISPEIVEAVDYVVGYKQLEKGNPKSSSIIKLGENGEVTIIRQ